MKKKKVCMLSVSPMIFDARIQREAQALRDGGYEVEIIHIDDQKFIEGIPNLKAAKAKYEDEMKGITTISLYLVTRMWGGPAFFNKTLQAIEMFFKLTQKTIQSKADYYQCNDLIPALFCWFGKWTSGGKIIYDAHELEVPSNKGLRNKFMSWYEQLTVNKSSAIITVNSHIAEIMKEKYGKEVNVIANRPFLIKNEDLNRSILRKDINLPVDAKLIMYVGYLNKVRGVKQVVESLKYLPDNYLFLIMGVGRLEEYKKYLNEIIESNNIAPNRVRFIGPFSTNEVIHYLSGADISTMLYQARDNNSVVNAPNKFYQSIMARVPILASHNKTFPEYIYKNRIGKIGETVDEKNPKEIAEKIIEITKKENSDFYRKNSNLLADEVNWEKEAVKLVRIYNSVD